MLFYKNFIYFLINKNNYYYITDFIIINFQLKSFIYFHYDKNY